MFYDAVPDPYCYLGTSVLKNRLGLRTLAELDAFEHDMTAQRFDEALPAGRLGVTHFKASHRHMFQDVYWAPCPHAASWAIALRAMFSLIEQATDVASIVLARTAPASTS